MAMEREAWKRDVEQAKTQNLVTLQAKRKIRRIFSVRNGS